MAGFQVVQRDRTVRRRIEENEQASYFIDMGYGGFIFPLAGGDFEFGGLEVKRDVSIHSGFERDGLAFKIDRRFPCAHHRHGHVQDLPCVILKIKGELFQLVRLSAQKGGLKKIYHIGPLLVLFEGHRVSWLAWRD